MIFHTVEKLCTKKVYPAWAGFHAVEKMGQIVPRCGNIISTPWKNGAISFRTVEKSSGGKGAVIAARGEGAFFWGVEER